MRAVRNNGFTLAEILVASTISAFVAMVAVGTLKAITDSAQVVTRTSEATAEIRFAARLLARDLTNLYRDPDPRSMRLLGASQGSDAGGPAFLTFYTVGRAKARAAQPEGDVYEVEYLLANQDRSEADENENAAPQVETMTLFRRLWPNPHIERTPGGILTPIAQNIGLFQVRFYDGQQWAGEWPEEMESIPELIEVTLASAPPEGRGAPIVETIVVSWARLTERSPAGLPSEGQDSGSPQEAPAPEANGGQSGSEARGGPR